MCSFASRLPSQLRRSVRRQWHAMSGKGKGKAKEAPAGTKSISSFFAKKPPPSAAAPPQADAPDAPSPAKRARVQHVSDASDAVTPPPLPLSAEPSDAAAPRASAATGAGDDDEMVDAQPPPRPQQRPAAPRAPAAPLAIPASDPERHAHFSERLSLGPPRRNGAARDALLGAPMSAYGRDAGPGGPYTPLERQIVALKRAHPGILLMIEARARCVARRVLAGNPASAHC
jgi:DNA mismatch repair protein MSH3